MKQNTASTDATPMNQNQFGHVFSLDTTYGGNLQIRQEFTDGSTGTFVFDPDYAYEVSHVGSDETVMLKKIHNDGSAKTFTVPTAWFDSIEGAVSHHFNE
jgi:hypothetical protein